MYLFYGRHLEMEKYIEKTTPKYKGHTLVQNFIAIGSVVFARLSHK